MIRPRGFWPRLRWRFGVLWWQSEAVAIVTLLSVETIAAAARSVGLRW